MGARRVPEGLPVWVCVVDVDQVCRDVVCAVETVASWQSGSLVPKRFTGLVWKTALNAGCVRLHVCVYGLCWCWWLFWLGRYDTIPKVRYDRYARAGRYVPRAVLALTAWTVTSLGLLRLVPQVRRYVPRYLQYLWQAPRHAIIRPGRPEAGVFPWEPDYLNNAL